ncbi:MAG TPA: hypothetical protein VGI40_07830 [Pirellulaceae bacterium]|jgi:hypothetical protein
MLPRPRSHPQRSHPQRRKLLSVASPSQEGSRRDKLTGKPLVPIAPIRPIRDKGGLTNRKMRLGWVFF